MIANLLFRDDEHKLLEHDFWVWVCVGDALTMHFGTIMASAKLHREGRGGVL